MFTGGFELNIQDLRNLAQRQLRLLIEKIHHFEPTVIRESLDQPLIAMTIYKKQLNPKKTFWTSLHFSNIGNTFNIILIFSRM